MLVDLLWLLMGLVLIVRGGEVFVAAAVRVAELLRVPRVVIGSTLVSLATTSPEMVVSVVSGLEGESALAVGNAVGSCVCNIGLILGVTASIKHVDVHPRALRTPLIAMLASALLLLILTLDLLLTRWQGALLLFLGSSYFAWDFWQHYRDRKSADIAEATAIEQEVSATRWAWPVTKTGTGVQFCVGAVVVVFGSKLLVDGAIGLAERLGVAPMVMGLTVLAVGTSLPELVTAISSSRKSVSDLAVGNVLGANIANLTLIVGLAAVFDDVEIDPLTQVFSFPALLVVMTLFARMLLRDRAITRRQGRTLLVMYAVYMAMLLVLTMVAGG